MTRVVGVRSFTMCNAGSIGRDVDQGSLEPGKRADLIALSDDVFTCAEEQIAGVNPVLTMVDGVVAYAADQDVGASRSASRASSTGSTSDTSA